ncbi:flagellar biosynthetic protein FliO [Cryobacterium sp. Y11]|uniref:FliO/MopB family protein n=1 Tax=Cryobacterium sp. Y11 TaxID=2045016 RepID=UPI001304FE59|nr:flagellar biosynthetic protein FliO [Cryobacterium sp. Y11]
MVALRVVLSLGVVFGLLWYLQRRLVTGGRAKVSANLVTVVGRANVGQKASVVVVDVDGQRLVLGVTEHAVSVLHGSTVSIDDASQTDAATSAAETASLPAHTPFPAPIEASGTVFARSLHSATDQTISTMAAPDSTLALTTPLEFRPRRKTAGKTSQSTQAAPASRLAGSILSPATWTQTAAAIRNGR